MKIKSFFKKIITEAVKENNAFIVGNIQKEIAHTLFAYIGIQRMKDLITMAESKKEKYVTLADLYSATLRTNLSKENSEIIHNYFELMPTLNQYFNSLKKVSDE